MDILNRLPCVHLNGCGCQKCGMIANGQKSYESRQKLSSEEVIRRISCYSRRTIRFITSRIHKPKTKIKLICSIHGEFFILPKNVFNLKQGCHACGRLSTSRKLTSAQEDVIKRFQEAHGGLYDYSQVVYTGIINKVKIICSVHGPFWQRPNNHMDGHGCAACGNSLPYTAETFAERAAVVHSNKYGYERVVYKNNTTHVTITCPEHGDFEQLPLSHLVGKGCWKCRTLGYSKQQIAWLEWRSVRDGVYIQHALNEGEHRIANSSYRSRRLLERHLTPFMSLRGTWWHGSLYHPLHLSCASDS